MKIIEENNILIANFVGDKYGIIKNPNIKGSGHIEPLKEYNTSWDLLMPVVEKIETTLYKLGDRVGAASRRLGLSEESKDTVEIYLTYDSREEYKGWSWTLAFLYAKDIASSTERKDKKIHAMYEAVVEFIKWYNKNKK